MTTDTEADTTSASQPIETQSVSTEQSADTTTTVSESGTKPTSASTATVPTVSGTETTAATTNTATDLPDSTETATKPSGTGADVTVLYGDVNLDGRVDITDAVLLNKAVAGAVKLGDQAFANADCAQDGELSSDDAISLLQFLVHLIDSLPTKS